MNPEARKALAVYLAEHAGSLSRRDGPRWSDGRPARPYLVRGGCTLAPDAYLFTVIDRADPRRAEEPAEEAVVCVFSPILDRGRPAGAHDHERATPAVRA